MVEGKEKESQASTEDSEEAKAAAAKEKEVEVKDKLYPNKEDEKTEETAEEKTARETKEAEDKASEEKAATDLIDRAKEAGLEEGATEEEVAAAEKVIEKKKVAEENKTVAERQDEYQSALDAYEKDPTPENKEALKQAKELSKKAIDKEKNSEIKYDVKLPEGSLLPEKRIEEIVAYSRERGFSNEVAQSLVERETQAVLDHVVQASTEVNELVNVQWPKQASEDKEIGGDDFNKNAELSKRVLNKFASPELINLLDPKTEENPMGTNYGNNPELMRLLVRVGRAMSDDQLLLSKGKGPEKKSVAETFYGPSKEKE